MADRHILDNRTSMVAGYLAQSLAGADDFCFVSAYFAIHGCALLANQLETVAGSCWVAPARWRRWIRGERSPRRLNSLEGGLGGGDQPNLLGHQELASEDRETVKEL